MPQRPWRVRRLAQLERRARRPRPGRSARRGRPRCRASPLGLDQDRVVERRQGAAPWPVPWPATRRPFAAAKRDRLGDVLGALDEGDRARAQVGGEVPAEARLVPVGVAGVATRPSIAQLGEVASLQPPVSSQLAVDAVPSPTRPR